MRTLRFKSVLNLSGQDFQIRRLAPTAGDHFATYGMCTVRYQLFRDACAHAITQVISHACLRGWIQRWLTEMGVGLGTETSSCGRRVTRECIHCYARRPPCQSAPCNNEPQLQLQRKRSLRLPAPRRRYRSAGTRRQSSSGSVFGSLLFPGTETNARAYR
jgi:hypothetical protein